MRLALEMQIIIIVDRQLADSSVETHVVCRSCPCSLNDISLALASA